MVRPNQLLQPTREPVPLRPAATVLLLRDGTVQADGPRDAVMAAMQSAQQAAEQAAKKAASAAFQSSSPASKPFAAA